jgi:hypothetical protein
MKCIECRCCRKGWYKSKPNSYVCIGVPEPFVISDVNVNIMFNIIYNVEKNIAAFGLVSFKAKPSKYIVYIIINENEGNVNSKNEPSK